MGYVSAKSLKDAGSSVYVEIFTDGVDYTSGTTTTLTASEPLPAANAVWVYFDGVVQHHSEYGVSGYSVVFTSAIPADTANVEIQFNKEVNVGIPGQNTITHSMMTANNISTLLRKNAIINGGFDIWQRGTSQTSNGYGSDDRWDNGHIGSSKTASQQSFTVGQTDVPNNPTYYSRTVVTHSAGTGNLTYKQTRIEGVSTFSGQTITLSFWAKADATKDIATEFGQSFGTGGSPSAAVVSIGVTTHSLTTSWAKYTATVSIPSISGKTLGSNGDDYVTLTFFFEAGTDFDARTNSLGQQSGTFDIAQVQLEAGSDATDFEKRSAGEEAHLCYRYYWRRSADEVANARIGTGGIVQTTTGCQVGIWLPVPMRDTPSLTHGTVSSMVIYDGSLTNVVTALTAAEASREIFNLSVTTTGGTLTVGRPAQLTRDFTDTNAWVAFDAEL